MSTAKQTKPHVNVLTYNHTKPGHNKLHTTTSTSCTFYKELHLNAMEWNSYFSQQRFLTKGLLLSHPQNKTLRSDLPLTTTLFMKCGLLLQNFTMHLIWISSGTFSSPGWSCCNLLLQDLSHSQLDFQSMLHCTYAGTFSYYTTIRYRSDYPLWLQQQQQQQPIR